MTDTYVCNYFNKKKLESFYKTFTALFLQFVRQENHVRTCRAVGRAEKVNEFNCIVEAMHLPISGLLDKSQSKTSKFLAAFWVLHSWP